MSIFVARSQYDDRPVLASDLSFEGDKGLTKQSDAKDCDINAIFKRFERTGQLPDMILKDGRYGDFSGVLDYQQSIAVVRHAEEQFANLDVSLRNEFANDPAKFLAWVEKASDDDLEKRGLLKPEAVEARKVARIKAAEEAAKAAEAKAAMDERVLIDKIKAELQK